MIELIDALKLKSVHHELESAKFIVIKSAPGRIGKRARLPLIDGCPVI